MKIVAIDLGKYESTSCLLDLATGEQRLTKLRTTGTDVAQLIARSRPDRVVIEVGPSAGWVCDLVRAMGITIQVANPNHQAWRWKHVKRKTDRDDAIKLAQLSSMNQLPMVEVPARRVRQWRGLIRYRHRLVARRTAIKNHVRSILQREGRHWPAGRAGWSSQALAELASLARPMQETGIEDLWRGLLHIELEAFAAVQELLKQVEAKLDALSRQDQRVQLLQTIPGVGPRLSELVVAIIDNPRRFRNGKQVGAYAGLVPRQFESGTMSREGGITCHGNGLLRALLVEASWVGMRYNPWLRQVYDGVCRGMRNRRKTAIIAAARRLLIRCWAMLRDGTSWRPPCSTLGACAG